MLVEGRLALYDKPVDEFLSMVGHVADDVIVTSDGSHIGMVKLDGRALSLLDDETRYAERRRLHAFLRAIAGPRVTLYTHHVCHDQVTPFELGEFSSAWARKLAGDYTRGIEAGILAREWLVTVVIRPSTTESLWNLLIGRPPDPDPAKIEEVRSITTKLHAMLNAYRPVTLGVREHNGDLYSEIGEAIGLVLYGRRSAVPMGSKLAARIYTRRVVCGMRGFEIRGSGASTWGRMLGFREYPETVKPWLMDGLLKVRARLVLTNSFNFVSGSEVTSKFRLKRNRMVTGGMTTASLAAGLEAAGDDIESGRLVYGMHHASIAVHGDTLEEMQKSAAAVEAVLSGTTPLSMVAEEVGCFPAFWGQVYGGPSVCRPRQGYVHGYNFGGLSSFNSFPGGEPDRHWGRPVMRVLTEGHTACDWQAHVRQVAQLLIIGPPGYGKSVFLGLLSAMLEQVLHPVGGVCVILDKDGSNELSVRARGGYYTCIRVGQESGMAPLKALQDTLDARQFLNIFILGLIMADGGPQPPAAMTERLDVAVSFVMRQEDPKLRCLGSIRAFLDHGDGSTGSRLEQWCEGGSKGWAFDGQTDLIRFEAGVVGIDNTEILPKDMEVIRTPAAAYQLHRIKEVVGRGRRGAVLVDEGASYMPDGRFQEAFDDFQRTLRKGNGLFALVCHGPGDIERHPLGASIVQNSPMKILFPNPGADTAAYREFLHCSDGEMEQIVERMHARGPGTFLVKTETGSGSAESFVARASLEGFPDHLAVLSATPAKRDLWHSIEYDYETTDPEIVLEIFLSRYAKEARS